MALSVQNKNFLSLLHKLDLEVKEFPDLSFDGLFQNVPKDINYFFNWFLENITVDNILTRSEQAIYFELEKNQMIPSEEEVNYVLSSCQPNYEDLKALDANYVKNVLSEDLEELNKNHGQLTEICSKLHSDYNEVKNKENSLKEDVNTWKKQLVKARENCRSINESYNKTLNEVKMFLLTEPQIRIDLDLYKVEMQREKEVFNSFKKSEFLEKEINQSLSIGLLPQLEDDLTCVDILLVLSQATLKEKKTEIEVLTELLQRKSLEKSCNDSISYYLMQAHEGMSEKVVDEIQKLESELCEKIKDSSCNEVQKILVEYYEKKLGLNRTLISKLAQCKDYIKSNKLMSSWLLHILIRCNTSLENAFHLRKEFLSKLSKDETNLSNSISSLELRKQRFKEVSNQMDQHPFLLALKEMNIDQTSEDMLKKINEMISDITGDYEFVQHNLRRDLQLSIKNLFDNVLCGPTSEILFVPIELMIKFHNCQERGNELSREVKRLANKYVETKESISKSDRRRLLLWIDFLTNPAALKDS